MDYFNEKIDELESCITDLKKLLQIQYKKMSDETIMHKTNFENIKHNHDTLLIEHYKLIKEHDELKQKYKE